MGKHFSELIKDTKTESEKRGLNKLFLMMLTLRQQINLRRSKDGETLQRKNY